MKRTLILGALLAASLGSAIAQVTPPDVARQQKQELRHGDPARWYKADTTQKAEMATLRKEINAALQEALQACKQADADMRRDCVREARATYQDDMANLREIHTASKDLSKTYETSGQ
jgi:uncharacterized protein YdbL (DUF1318 family)